MEEEGETLNIQCHGCGGVGFADGSDGFFYCIHCGSQADDIIDTGVADEDFVDKGTDARGALYLASHRRHLPQSAVKPELQYNSQSQLWSQLTQSQSFDLKNTKREEEDAGDYDAVGPTMPEDFGASSSILGYEDFYNEVRIRYLMGLQTMLQLQCEALVRDFGAPPIICGIAGPIWLRFVASTRVSADEWADEAIHESESRQQGELDDVRPRAKYSAEPHNIYGKRAVMIWYRSLRKVMPLSCSLAISFLACHVARESILPTDIVKWSIEGKLPYFAAFIEIEKKIGPPSNACSLSSNLMFRPSQAIPSQKLEALAASIALSTGLDLPPVNFYAIASRYLSKLGLSAEKIFPHACRLHEWSMPPELWLSANELRLPTRVCVMSILIVTIRILYNIHGFGEWEKSLSDHQCKSLSSGDQIILESTGDSKMKEDIENGFGYLSDAGNVSNTRLEAELTDAEKSELDTMELLRTLDARYNDLGDTYEYYKDLPTYLQFCKDVVFAGLDLCFEDYEEEKIIEELWNFYQDRKDAEDMENWELPHRGNYQKRFKDVNDGCSKKSSMENKSLNRRTSYEDGNSMDSTDNDHSLQGSLSDGDVEPKDQKLTKTHRDRAIKQLKLDMEENRFFYMPPRVKIKRHDYLRYIRQRDDGALAYVAHADYYILLRACAKVAQVEIRCMHMGVLNFERRLAWIENKIDHCLDLIPPDFSGEFCSGESQEDGVDNVPF